MSFGHIQIVEAPLAPEGSLYLVDTAAMRLRPSVAVSEPLSFAVDDRSGFILGMRVAIGPGSEIERDPSEWPIARSWRGLWRQVKAIAGYEWRKSTGELRRVSRRHGVITGITS